MCLDPISVPSQTKYVSFRYRDRFFNQFGCGHCAECLMIKSCQWSFRSFYEFEDLPIDGYVMFDCLSYRSKDLPHLSEFWTMLDKQDDYPCFNRLHIRRFSQTLRQRVIRAGYSSNSVRWYYCAEYGTKPRRTHRPHYHIMLFVRNCIPYEWLSRQIAECWKYGRTDGIPYKSSRYVYFHNVVERYNLASRLRCISYITKYLQKNCMFQSVLNARVYKVMNRLAQFANPDDPDKWLQSEYARRERLKLLRMVNQFHRTSQHFGETALDSMDFNELVMYGSCLMPDSKNVAIRVPLSTFYKRKLFYENVTVNGSRYWQLNELGKEYYAKRKPFILQNLSDRLTCLSLDTGVKIDADLSSYLLDSRGRIIADTDEESPSIQSRLDDLDLYNYSTTSDKLQFGCRGLSQHWLGDPQQGYECNKIPDRLSLSYFLSHYVYFDEKKEAQLDLLYTKTRKMRECRDNALKIRQRMANLSKMLS